MQEIKYKSLVAIPFLPDIENFNCSIVKIYFNNSSVIVELKTKKQACHTFVFGDFSLDRASVFTRFLTVRLKTSAKYTEECIEKLSHIKKIETFNNYKEEKK